MKATHRPARRRLTVVRTGTAAVVGVVALLSTALSGAGVGAGQSLLRQDGGLLKLRRTLPSLPASVRGGSASVQVMASPPTAGRGRAGGTPLLSAVPLPATDAIAVDERTDRVFVTRGIGYVSTLDAITGRLLHTVSVRPSPLAVAADAMAGHVFVSGGEMLDARTGAVLRPLGFGGISIGVDSPTRRLFVVGVDGVDVRDVRSGALLHSVALAPSPTSVPVVLDRRGRVALLLRSPLDDRTGQIVGPGQLVVLDGRTAAVLRRITVGDVNTFGLYAVVAADLRTKRLFVLDGGGVRVFDTTRL